jgi:septum formation protein
MAGTKPIALPAALEQRFIDALRPRPRLILGSASRSRRAIMDELAQRYGFSYEVATADIDEKAIRCPLPGELVVTLAHAKARAIISRLQLQAPPPEPLSGFLVTCDQVVVHEGRILEKPESEAEAREFITGYARAHASTVGSVVVTDLRTGATFEGVDTAHIHIAPLPVDAVDALIAEGEVFWCAGGLMIEHPQVAPHITRIEGTEDSVMGLSARLLAELLARAAGR